jgi:glycosidase
MMGDTKKVNGDAVNSDTLGSGAANYHDDGATTILMNDTDIDSSKVGFLNGKKDGDGTKSGENDSAEFVGLRKEDLAKFATDPYWVRLRIILLVLFVFTWIAMLVASIIIIVLAPRCPHRPAQEWYEKAVVYHVHPLSFQDTNNDGNGDIKGIQSRLEYLRDELKVSALSLGPMYPSPVKAFGYDVINFKAICPGHYGTMEDFDALRLSLHKSGMKMIMDFVPNHTSKKHGWFKKSSNSTANGHDTYKDYYIWHSGANGDKVTPPNDWKSVTGGPAWTWHEGRQLFYYHTYSSDEPDLNLRNPAVVGEINDTLNFWLDRKVDGFRMVGVQYLVEPENLAGNDTRDFLLESVELVSKWRHLVDDYSTKDGKSRSSFAARVLIVDVKGSTEQSLLFSTDTKDEGATKKAHIVSNKALMSLKTGCTATCIMDAIMDWKTAAVNVSSNWQVSGIDMSRVTSRYGNDMTYVNAVNMLLLTLDGTAFPFYGDELGMSDATVNDTVTITGKFTDVQSGRGQLTPMQWNNFINAGFTATNVTPWMPISDNYQRTNLQTQQALGSGVNHVKVFSRLVELRQKSESFLFGSLDAVDVQGNVLMYMREAEGFDSFLIAINFGPVATPVDFEEYQRRNLMGRESKNRLPLEMKIVSSTFNFAGAERADLFANGTKVNVGLMIYLEPTEGIILSWPPHAERLYA